MSNQLTAREKDVAALVVTGLKSKQIGQRLGMKTGTVQVTLGRIYMRLHLDNRTQLAVWVRDHMSEVR